MKNWQWNGTIPLAALLWIGLPLAAQEPAAPERPFHTDIHHDTHSDSHYDLNIIQFDRLPNP